MLTEGAADRAVIVRVAAWISLVLGVCGFLISLHPLGVPTGAGAGVFALLFGWAVLREHPLGWTRRAARGGMIAGGRALAVCALWIVLAVVLTLLGV